MFTDKYIKTLTPKAKPYRVFEKGADKGFGIQVVSNKKSFFIQYKSPVTKKRRFMRLGGYPDTTLGNARTNCRNARKALDNGLDPQIEKEKSAEIELRKKIENEKAKAIEKATGTVQELFDSYIDSLENQKKRSHTEVRRLYEKDIKKSIGKKKARDVTPDDIKMIIRAVYQRGAHHVATQLRSYLLAAFNHGIQIDFDPTAQTESIFRIEHNPVRDIPVTAKVTPGERNLTAEEIHDLWKTIDHNGMSLASKSVIKLLFATGGQRVEEVIGMKWSEIDETTKRWELPSARTKNEKPHVVPLSNLALSIIEGMKIFAREDCDYVFPHNNKNDRPMPYQSITQAVSRLCNPPIKTDGSKTEGFPKFVPKDIRRTAKSRMGEIGISKEIRDRLHNHALHDVSSKHYDRYDYFDQKLNAMNKWTLWLERIINDIETPNNVIELK